jgi:hypothetical protein
MGTFWVQVSKFTSVGGMHVGRKCRCVLVISMGARQEQSGT